MCLGEAEQVFVSYFGLAIAGLAAVVVSSSNYY